MTPATMTPIQGGLLSRLLRGAAAVLVILGLIVLMPPAAKGTVELADAPMETRFQPAPANIMVIQDDSGSMDFDFMVLKQYDGGYPYLSGGTSVYSYLFDNVGDDVYGSDSNRYLGSERRAWWKTQWHKVNLMYYNPAVTYDPWPTLANAGLNNPKSHPVRTPVYTLNLDGTSYTLGGTSASITGVEKIIDSHGTGFSKIGDWNSFDTTECYGGKCYDTNNSISDYYTATWAPNLVAGWYYVEAQWRDNSSYAAALPFTITHAGGSLTVTANQESNCCKFNRLHVNPFYFTGSSDEKVQILNFRPGDSGNHACADAVKFVPAPDPGVVVPHARYYVWSSSQNKPYLVVLRGGTQAIEYYAVNQVRNEATSVQGAATAEVAGSYFEKVTQLELVSSPPADVQAARTYLSERQNFANWFSYYRRRRGVAVAALSNSLTSLSGVRLGIMGMNYWNSDAIKKPLLPLKLRYESSYYDFTANLLTALYGYTGSSGTPTRLALETVGNYYKSNADNLLGVSGESAPYKTPFFSEDKGGACQQCYTIIVSDGMENGDPPSTTIGNADGGYGFPYADNWSRTQADVAMYFYAIDLNTSLPNKVVPNIYDPATWQHMVTYGVTMGVYGTMNPDDYDTDFKHKVTGQPIVWPEPQRLMPSSVDDLWHATVNSRGQYLNGNDYQELANALKQVIQNIAARIGSSSSVSVNGDQLFGKITDEILLFQAVYNTTNWTGDVRAHKLNTTTGAVVKTDVNGNPVYEWSAAEKLDARNWTTRNIATYRPDTGAGIAFDYANLSSDQKSSLNSDTNIVDYVKGKAVTGFRERASRLGDIVHSSPVFAGTTLYVGANDGMLHAFDTDTGAELFGYVPSFVIPNLKYLKETNYSHKYYVNQTPTVKKGHLLLGVGSNDTILVGGLGKGGKGYYALNVTDPAAMNTPAKVAEKVLWEYPREATSSDEEDDIGYSYSKPVVVKSNDPAYPWVVIFGNGYESSRQDPVLFILNAQDGTLVKKITAVDASDSGLSTPIAVDADKNGTVDFVYAGDLQGNMWKFDLTSTSKSDWAVAFKNAGNVAQPLFKAKGPGGSVQPITTKPDVMYHPRYHGYMVVFGTGKYLADVDYNDTSTQSVYGIWDFGDRWYNGTTATANGFTPDDDREYVGEFNRASTAKLSNLHQNISLLQQTRVFDLVVGGATYRVMSANKPVWKLESDATTGQMPNPSTTQLNHAGWYFDLPVTRERVISDVSLREGKAIVISYTPDSDPCKAGGTSFLMELNADTGGALNTVQFDINEDAKLTRYKDPSNPGDYVYHLNQYHVPAGMQFDGNLQPPAILRLNSAIEIKYSSSSTGEVEVVRERAVRMGMGYWRELED